MPSDDEDELAWIKKVDHEGNSYIVLNNLSSRTIKAGEQIMFFYGRYTNAYLLLNYGFCLRDNRFDQLDVYLDLKPRSLMAEDFVCLDYTKADEPGIKKVCLKADILNEKLMNYLRFYIQTEKRFYGPDHDIREPDDPEKARADVPLDAIDPTKVLEDCKSVKYIDEER